jgi:hypothetical protein
VVVVILVAMVALSSRQRFIHRSLAQFHMVALVVQVLETVQAEAAERPKAAETDRQ